MEALCFGNHFLHDGVEGSPVNVADKVNEEQVFPVVVADGTRFDFAQVQGIGVKDRKRLKQGARHMGQVKGDADFIAVGAELHAARHDHKPGDIGLGQVDVLCQNTEAVDGGGPAAGDGGKSRVGALCHMLGGHGGVVVGQALPVRVGGEELTGLLKALGVGVYLADVRKAASGHPQKTVLNLDLGFPDNIAVVLG